MRRSKRGLGGPEEYCPCIDQTGPFCCFLPGSVYSLDNLASELLGMTNDGF